MPNKSKNNFFKFLIFIIPVVVILTLIGYSLGIFKEPKLNLVNTDFPSQIYKQTQFPITTTNSKINVNGRDIIGDNYKYNIPLEAGKNKLKIAASNYLNRLGSVKEVELTNIQNDWNKTSCNELDFVLNTDNMQYGYSGINNDELPEQRAKYLDITKNDYTYVKLLKFNCESTNSQLQNHARIYTKGTKANCWNCDGNKSYITIDSTPSNINTPSPALVTEKSELRQESIYKSLSGISYRLIQIKSPDSTQFKFIASYEKNNRNYVVTGFDYIPDKHNEFITNFYSILDNIYPTDYNKNPVQRLSDQSQTVTLQETSLSGFKINYTTNWQVLSYAQPFSKEQNNTIKAGNTLELTKDAYSIKFTFYPSTDTITSGSIEDSSTDDKYTKIKIDNKDVQVPKVINIISTGIGSSNGSLRFYEKPAEVTSKSQNIYNNIVQTQKKKILINIEYNGLNYEYVDGVTKKLPTQTDSIKDAEILGILNTIKWGE